MNKLSNKLILTIFCLLQLVNISAILAKDITIKYEPPTRLNLSRGHINRIHFKEHKIKKIIGYKNLYSATVSGNKQDLFIRLNEQQEEPINISVIDNTGFVFDFELLQQERKTPLTVNIVTWNEYLLEEMEHFKEVQRMLEAMKRGIVSKYYVLKPNNKYQRGKYQQGKYQQGKLGLNIKHRIIKDYRFKNLRGLGLEVVNLSNKSISVKPNLLKKGVVGKVIEVSPNELIVKPRKKGKVYLIMEKGSWK